MSQPYCAAFSDAFEQLWIQQKGTCAICGKPMYRNRFEAPHARVWAKYRATVDHIYPRSKGGSDAMENLQLAHARCNKIKGNQL